MDSSPAQRLMFKRTKTTLPVAQHLLEPEIQPDVETKLTRKRRRAKKYYDRGSIELPELEIDQPISMMQSPTKKKWRRGVCVDKVAPRSYVVEVDGSTYRRNRKFLRRVEDRGQRTGTSSSDTHHASTPAIIGPPFKRRGQRTGTSSSNAHHASTPAIIGPPFKRRGQRTGTLSNARHAGSPATIGPPFKC